MDLNGSNILAENGRHQQHQDGGAGNMTHSSQFTSSGTTMNGNGNSTPTDNGSGYNDRPGGSSGKPSMGLLGDGSGPIHHDRHQHERERYYGDGRHQRSSGGHQQGVSKTNLYIRGLTPDTTDKDLHALCSP